MYVLLAVVAEKCAVSAEEKRAHLKAAAECLYASFRFEGKPTWDDPRFVRKIPLTRALTTPVCEVDLVRRATWSGAYEPSQEEEGVLTTAVKTEGGEAVGEMDPAMAFRRVPSDLNWMEPPKGAQTEF